MSKNNTRKIKCVSECSNKLLINPLTLITADNITEKSCSTNSINTIDFINNLSISKVCNENVSKEVIKKNMLFPNININYDYIVKMYNIDNIDSLKNWVESNIENKSYFTIERVINSWIITNIDELKFFNNGLVEIIKDVLVKFTKVKEVHINKELPNFIDYWIKKYSNNFYLNLFTDFKKYLNKKYNE